MKRIGLIICISFLLLSVTSCKKQKYKNYPSDIPEWLQEKIEAMNDDNEKFNKCLLCIRKQPNRCHYSVRRRVDEYFVNSKTYFAVGSSYNGYTVYDYNGVEFCHMTSGPPFCLTSSAPVRNVWEEDCNK